MDKEVQIWNLAKSLFEKYKDSLNDYGFSIHYNDDFWYEEMKIYHNKGYCFELKREKICELEEVKETAVEGLQLDGCVYSFTEPWDGFKIAGVEKAIKLLMI